MSLEISIPLFPFLLLLLLLMALLLLLIENTSFIRRRNLPPSPFKLPIIGNLHQLGSLPHRSLATLSNKHGPLMLLQLGQIPTLVISSADVAREIIKTQDHIFSNRPSLMVPNKLLYGCKDVAFAQYGDYWRNVRKLSVLHLLSPRRVQSYRHIREEEVAFMMNNISRLSSLGGLINLSDILMSFAKDVVSRVAFGKCSRDEGWDKAINVLIEESNDLLASFHFGDYVPWLAWLNKFSGLDARVKKTFGTLDEILEQIIERASGDGCNAFENDTFVDILLSIQKDKRLEISLNKDSIKALIEDMFGAGTDATIIVLEWTMAELLRNPEVMKKLQTEVRSKVSTNTTIKEEHLLDMKYLRAVIKEIMRLHPPGPLLIPRESMERTHVQGYEIPKQARVVINAWAIGRDGEHWEAPNEFRPERFLSSNVDFRGRDFQLIPFGSGRRICPGIHFAMSIIELALANLVQCFEWSLPDEMISEEMDMEEAPGITCRKKTSLYFVAKPYSLYRQKCNGLI